MQTIRSILAASLTVLLLVPNPAHAEDIDLYTGASSGGDANVLIVLDNESNWAATMDSNPPADADAVANCGGKPGSYYCAQKYALIKLLNKTKPDGITYFVGDNVGIGLMMYGSGANKGGYIRFGIRKMTRHQPGGPDQGPVRHAGRRQGQQQPGLRLDDVGSVQVFRWRHGQPVVIDYLGPDPDQRRRHGHRQARLPGQCHHGLRVLGRRRGH